jgi:hypothetical protein
MIPQPDQAFEEKEDLVDEELGIYANLEGALEVADGCALLGAEDGGSLGIVRVFGQAAGPAPVPA